MSPKSREVLLLLNLPRMISKKKKNFTLPWSWSWINYMLIVCMLFWFSFVFCFVKCFQTPVKERMHYKFEVQFEQSQTKSEQWSVTKIVFKSCICTICKARSECVLLYTCDRDARNRQYSRSEELLKRLSVSVLKTRRRNKEIVYYACAGLH